MAERPTSFAQQEILAPLEPMKGELIYVAKKISSGVVHEVPADLKKKQLTSDPQAASMGGYYTARTQRVDMLD
jgi:hypothetical protein